MNKYVIYSVLVGSYDVIRQPLVIDDRFDYVLFSDINCSDSIGVWKVRSIPFHGENAMHSSRYAKCLPTEVLEAYDASLYIDANIQISSSFVYERFFELVNSGTEWAGVRHPSQSCAYEEMCAIVSLRWVHDYNVIDWFRKLKLAHFPQGWGLYENNVIFRIHNQKIADVDKIWWESILKYCSRDQFSLMYALWCVNPRMGYVIDENDCPRIKSPFFSYYEHNSHSRILRLSFNEKMRLRCIRVSSNSIREGYMKLFSLSSRFSYPRVFLWIWGLFASVIYSPKLLKCFIINRTSVL